MRILNKVSNIKKHLHVEKLKGHSIGFIPTMGALHEGHISLLEKSKLENDLSVVSIFVNPTQFNEKEDLKKYPRNLEKDTDYLTSNDCDFLFAPKVKDVYPKNLKTFPDLDISHLVQNMEGPNRPGHFEGVVQVVHRLLKIIKPDKLYMGQKDFQQFSIIDYMLKSFKMHTQLRVCPILRETSGLAMSSRNQRLEPEIKKDAHIIYDMLNYAKSEITNQKIEDLEKYILRQLETGPFKPEYFKIVDGYTMEEIHNPKNHDFIVAGTAVWAGEVRLIDNMILKGEKYIYS